METGARDKLDRAFCVFFALKAERAAMADEDATGEAMVERSLCDDPQGDSRGIDGLVDMKIEIESLTRGQAEKRVKRFPQARNHISHRAKQARAVCVDHG